MYVHVLSLNGLYNSFCATCTLHVMNGIDSKLLNTNHTFWLFKVFTSLLLMVVSEMLTFGHGRISPIHTVCTGSWIFTSAVSDQLYVAQVQAMQIGLLSLVTQCNWLLPVVVIGYLFTPIRFLIVCQAHKNAIIRQPALTNTACQRSLETFNYAYG